jgi:hypothetical protein
MLKREKESVKKDKQARRERSTSDAHTEGNKTTYIIKLFRHTGHKNALDYKQCDRQSYEQETNSS